MAFVAFNEAATPEIARISAYSVHVQFKWFLPFKIKDCLEVLQTTHLMLHLLVGFLV